VGVGLSYRNRQFAQRGYETHIMSLVTRPSFSRYVLKCPLRTLRFRLLISFVVGYVSAGFVQATIFSKALPTLHDRITEGIAQSFMGTILFGMGYEYGNTISLWPYTALTTTVAFLIWMIIGYLREPPPRVD
jgi:hypothetical protein